jgi:hypothetical protein
MGQAVKQADTLGGSGATNENAPLQRIIEFPKLPSADDVIRERILFGGRRHSVCREVDCRD